MTRRVPCTLGVAAAAILLALAALAPPTAAARRADGWFELRTPHFIVISNAGDERGREVAEALEGVRAMLRRVTMHRGQMGREPREPVVVFALAHARDLRALVPQFWEDRGPRPAGLYWAGPYRHYIALRVDTPERDWRRRAAHEYVHVIVQTNVPDVPAWLDEGLAELWSRTTPVRGNEAAEGAEIEVGGPVPDHLRTLRTNPAWIALSDLVAMTRPPAPRDRKRLELFYAQAWALAHYTMLGRGAEDLSLGPPRYLEALRQGRDAVTAARQAFGDLATLERDLREYVRSGLGRAARVKWTAGPKTADLKTGRYEGRGGDHGGVRVLAPAEALVVRAQAIVDGERPQAALPLLTDALRLAPNEPAVFETLGIFCFRQNRPLEAARWLDRAIATGSASYLAHFYRAILTAPQEGTPQDGTAAPADALVAAAGHLERAITLNPRFAPAYARLAGLYARDAGRRHQAVTLARRAAELSPDDPAYWLELGRLLALAGQPGEAREAGHRALAAARSARERELVERFLRDLERQGPAQVPPAGPAGRGTGFAKFLP